MVGLLSSLEPRHENAGIIMFDELDEVNEVIFFHRGSLDLGFEINRFKHYCVRIKDDLLIGAYNISYNKRTRYIYKTNTQCSGFFIRRDRWWEILNNEEHKDISGNLVEQCKIYYFDNIHSKMKVEKEIAVKKWRSRCDYEAMISMKDYTHIHIQDNTMKDGEGQTTIMDEFSTFEKLIDQTTMRNDSILYRWDSLYQKYQILEKKYKANLVKIENLNCENEIMLGLRSSIRISENEVDCAEMKDPIIIMK